MPNQLHNRLGKGQFISVENIEEFIGGKIPLNLLSEAILNYIDNRITALAPGGGGGDVADAVNYNGSLTTSTSGNVVSQSVTSWKLRGFHIQGTGDGSITLTYTVGASSKTIKVEIDDVNPQFTVVLPNPVPIDDSTSVTLAVTNNVGTSETYTGVVFGEAV